MSTASLTAMTTSLMRAAHSRIEAAPLIDDPWGDALVSDDERALVLEALGRMLPPGANTQGGFDAVVRANPTYLGIIVRTRWADELLAAAVRDGTDQVVVLGAGLDTSAWRLGALLAGVTIVEVDREAVQDDKRRRLARAGLTCPPSLHFVAADLERDDPAAALARSPFRAGARTFVSCLGVVPYLTPDATLRVFGRLGACCAPGSDLVFDYLDADAFRPERTAPSIRRLVQACAAIAEPLAGGLDAERLPAAFARLGLRLVDDLDAAAVHARWLSERTDDLHFPAHAHLAHAVVAERP